jgi:hypothetical protein
MRTEMVCYIELRSGIFFGEHVLCCGVSPLVSTCKLTYLTIHSES